MASGVSLLEPLYHHLILPPRLPNGREELRDGQLESEIATLLATVATTIQNTLGDNFKAQYRQVIRSIHVSHAIATQNGFNKAVLLTEFAKFKLNGPGVFLFLDIASQNAGLLIWKAEGSNDVMFEAFEASPNPEHVLKAKSALQIDFPTSAASIPFKEFQSSTFQAQLSTFLEQASTESIPQFAQKTRKAGREMVEVRGTCDSAVITSLLITMIQALGQSAKLSLIRKHVHDDVLWNDEYLPWRRCPYYLVARVALQRLFQVTFGDEIGRAHYKFFMVMLLVALMDLGEKTFHPEMITLTKAKICRRLAKLELDKVDSSRNAASSYATLFATLGPIFSTSINNANVTIEKNWEHFKNTTRKKITGFWRYRSRKLPHGACCLALRNSKTKLIQMVQDFTNSSQLATRKDFVIPLSLTVGRHNQFSSMISSYTALYDREHALRPSCDPMPDNEAARLTFCVKTSLSIRNFVEKFGTSYETCSLAISSALLRILESWICMDIAAVKCFPALKSFSPGIPVDICNNLRLQSYDEMFRLDNVEKYLRGRFAIAQTKKTIFEESTCEGNFAEVFFDSSPAMEQSLKAIMADSKAQRATKEDEYRSKTNHYNKVMKEVASVACDDVVQIRHPFGHDRKKCDRCCKQKTINRKKINIHENSLPEDPRLAKVVVFELTIPEAYEAYRSATWAIIGHLCHPKNLDTVHPHMKLHDYFNLRQFYKARIPTFGLASVESKSALQSHYRTRKFPTNLDEVCVPLGCKYIYFDSKLQTTVSQVLKSDPSFDHLLPKTIPSDSPFGVLLHGKTFTQPSEPSSNGVIASQSLCPRGINVQEWLAFQSVHGGIVRRWLSLLLEFSSSNLNISSEATSSALQELALTVGPAEDGSGEHSLRVVHAVFDEPSLCAQLLKQAEERLNVISGNWREVHTADLVITFLLRLYCFGGKSTAGHSLSLIERAREMTLKWMEVLVGEARRSDDMQTIKNYNHYALWSALLCRRTFVIYTDPTHSVGFARSFTLPSTLNGQNLTTYLRTTLALHECLSNNTESQSSSLRSTSMNDIRYHYQLRAGLRASLLSQPECLLEALQYIWPETEGMPRTYSAIQFFSNLGEWWAEMKVCASENMNTQVVHFHLLDGSLLVDGKPVGRLPDEFRMTPVIKELFGDISIYSLPSALPGMTYALTVSQHGYTFHVGKVRGRIIFRACHSGHVYEIVDREVFCAVGTNDLPLPLIMDCVHFLDLKAQTIEFRRKATPWRSSNRNWNLSLRTSIAERITFDRPTWLVDPHSEHFHFFAKVFQDFEDPRYIIIQQPSHFPFTVELRRLELNFHLNLRGRLQTNELSAEIDPNQDAGVFYGFKSSIVVRNRFNHQQRSILVPSGDFSWQKRGPHVEVKAHTGGNYVKFEIDEVLGRITCPADPGIVYRLALLHTLTSFVLPDTLTKRTGVEEALHILKSGISRPASPLDTSAYNVLVAIARLSPTRDYYPVHLKTMQKVRWNNGLPATIQHDGFNEAAKSLMALSDDLAPFYNLDPRSEVANRSRVELAERAIALRARLERPNAYTENFAPPGALPYSAKNLETHSLKRDHIFRLTKTIQMWPQKLAAPDIFKMIRGLHPLGGFNRVFDGTFSLEKVLNVDYQMEFGSMARFCRDLKPDDAFRLMFTTAPMLFSGRITTEMVNLWLSYAFFEDVKALNYPSWSLYSNFSKDEQPSLQNLIALLQNAIIPYPDTGSISQPMMGKKKRRLYQEAESAYADAAQNEIQSFARFLLEQWPCNNPSSQGFRQPSLINIKKGMTIVLLEFSRILQNLDLSRYLTDLQAILRNRDGEQPIAIRKEPRSIAPTPKSTRKSVVPVLRELFAKRSPYAAGYHTQDMASRGDGSTRSDGFIEVKARRSHPRLPQSPQEVEELRHILDNLAESKSIVRQKYANDLQSSLRSFKAYLESAREHDKSHIPSYELEQKAAVQEVASICYNQLRNALSSNDVRYKWLKAGLLWPDTSKVSILERLRSNSGQHFGTHMKEKLIEYALSLTNVQRILRAERAYWQNNARRLREELENTLHPFPPSQYPDWILLELECNILIRTEQFFVAEATINPQSGHNSVTQLSMGKGKSSVILPISAAKLADAHNLVRIVVPKPLLPQTITLLQQRLGRLMGRSLLHIPYSRRTDSSKEVTDRYLALHKAMMEAGGVMVAAPDHILSFKLSGLQRLSDGLLFQANDMTSVQSWLERHCRDIIDESDLLLSPRTALCYPSGPQSIYDGSPHRWLVAEALLGLVKSHLHSLKLEFPQSIDVVHRHSDKQDSDRRVTSFPFVFFLRRDAEEALISKIVESLYSGQENILPIMNCSRQERQLIKDFITEPLVSRKTVNKVTRMFPDKPEMYQKLLIIRGLLCHGILLLALKRRWSVQYGIDPRRDPLAVPFTAKGTPTDASEWGHPDVSILFTILSHYYSGLTIKQTREALHNIGQSDDPFRTFEYFVLETDLPASLRDWQSINPDDEVQITSIWRYVRHTPSVVEYYLNNHVFPRHAKQFSIKLQTTAWDLGLFPTTQPIGTPPRLKESVRTTGFSGTNDNKALLPLTVKQEDLPSLQHSNAEVLTYLLQSRNRDYVFAADNERRLSEVALLHKLKQMTIKVLIDAGASILEMANAEVAKAWLDIEDSADAALYFNSAHVPTIRYRNGKVVPFVGGSNLVDDLSKVVVYIDESHCRGTDLKLPEKARGALTLGLSLTKDTLMQAAMRLRQLGTTQSVTFISPPEVHRCILDLTKKGPNDVVDSADVLAWVMAETCDQLDNLFPLYYAMGLDFIKRRAAAVANPNFIHDSSHRGQYLEALRDQERQSLAQLYEPKDKVEAKRPHHEMALPAQFSEYMRELDERRDAFQNHGVVVHASAMQEVEQEREIHVQIEIETVRELARPPHYTPCVYAGLHEDIRSFIRTGCLISGSEAIEHAYASFSRTAVGIKYGVAVSAVKSRLYSSVEFSQTVICPQPDDAMRRPVQFILYGAASQTAILITPEEAEDAIPLCRITRPSFVSLLIYSAPVTQGMVATFDSLNFCAIPALPSNLKLSPTLKLELGVLAGRLYFNFEEHDTIKDFLGLTDSEDVHDVGILPTQGCKNGNRAKKGKMLTATGFTSKPIPFLTEWISSLRKSEDWQLSPMGYLVGGKKLTAEHAFFVKRVTEVRQNAMIATGRAGNEEAAVEDDQYDDVDIIFDDEEEILEDGDEWLDAQMGNEDAHQDGESDEEHDYGTVIE